MSALSPEVYHTIRRIEILTHHLAEDLLAGVYHSAFKGQGMEFEEVREYTPGDDVRRIDWNVTARMQHPYVKIFKEERDLTVMLLVDVSASTYFGSQPHSKHEWIAEIAALLAFVAIKNNDKVGLLLFSSVVELYVPPRKGFRHVLRIIRELLVFKPKQKATDIKPALTLFKSLFHRTTICFCISDSLLELPKEEMAPLTKRHDFIYLCITDPLEKTFPSLGLVPATDLETAETALIDTANPDVHHHFIQDMEQKRAALKAQLHTLGASFVELPTDQPYILTLRKFFKMRSQRR